LSNNNNVKIVYDFPWYWICSKYVNRSTKWLHVIYYEF
jgi:hypothetical protein